MTTNESRLTAVETSVENEQEWRKQILSRLDRIEANQQTNLRWMVGTMIGTMLGTATLVATIIRFFG